jgi:hypothetical protein
LVEIDVASAQPLLLGFIAAKLIAADWILDDVKRLGSADPISEAFSSLPMEPWGATLPADLLDYLDICQDGTFYQTVAETWGLPCQSPSEKNRIKGLAYKRILFGRVRHGNPGWKAFRRRWPSVATALEQIKEDDHGTLARACQRIESRLMIDGVVGHFRRHHPDVPVQSIRDSVLVVPDAVETAREAILARFAGIGLMPTIKVKASPGTPEGEAATPARRSRQEQERQKERPSTRQGAITNTNTSSHSAPITHL